MTYGQIKGCRSCGSSHLDIVLDLGMSPLADRLLTKDQLGKPEAKYPLRLAVCHLCSLVQIDHTVAPEELFGNDYPYFSSVSDALQAHTVANVQDVIARRKLGPQSLVVELASNDGYLLKHYKQAGIQVLGIDPAEPPVKAAMAIGIETIHDFFTTDLAKTLAERGVKADVIHANNVLAHVADTNGFVEGIARLLKDRGVAVVEFPYLLDLIDHCEFDTIYHQHLCYFSVTAVDKLLRRHGLYLNDVRRIPIHGGSLRLFIERHEDVQPSVSDLLLLEHEVGLTRVDYFKTFGERVAHLRQQLIKLLEDLRRSGKRVVGYGAPAKGCTLVNYFGVDTHLVPYLVDKNQFKQGRYMSGTHQPIHDPSKLLEDRPDYVLMLPWNFADEILAQQTEFRAQGGRFIIPIPELRIV